MFRGGSPEVTIVRAFDWGWAVKLLLVPVAPVGHALLSAVGALAAASRGPGGGRANLYGALRGGCPSAPGSERDRLARRPHGNDAAPPAAGRKLRPRPGGNSARGRAETPPAAG